MTSPSQNSPDLSNFAGNWELDRDRTSIEFHTKALWVIPTKGTFRALEGMGTVSGDGGISGTFVIDAASVDTKNKKRDAHLRTADFFEVETFPTVIYEATSGRLTGPRTVDLDGTLTVHGETRPLEVSANLSVVADSVTVSAELDIDRSTWGLTLTPFGAGLMNRVVIGAVFRKA
ncbi:MAG: YceI family protein [Acidimicrobiales bacterium]|jgi:polyisoprenoid-binding protein YceI